MPVGETWLLKTGRFKGMMSLPVPACGELDSGWGESLPTACPFLLQYIFVSLISRDSVYDVLRRVCTHLQVPPLCISPCVHGPEALHLPFGLNTAPHHCLQGFGLLPKPSPIPSILIPQHGIGRGAGAMPWACSLPMGFSGSWMRQNSEFLLSLGAWV